MMFKGVTHHTQKCQEPVTPKLITWCRTRSAEMPTCRRTKGKGQVNIAEIPTLLHPSQPITGGHRQNAEMPLCYRPQLFTWCRTGHAEMLLKVRTKGRVTWATQKCHRSYTLPNQSHGAIFTPQQCQRMHAPPNLGHAVLAEMPSDCRPNNTDQRPPPLRRNAIAIAPRN